MKHSEYKAWAAAEADRIGEWGLARPHAMALRVVADFARDGRCTAAIDPTLASSLHWSPSYTHRVLRDLERVGLLKKEQRAGRPAVRLLHPEVGDPVVQLALGDPSTSERLNVRTSELQTPEPLTPSSDERVKRTEGGEGAREQPLGLATTFETVLGVLNAAPGLVVEPLAVNSILLGYPESGGYDHERAAHTVASWSHESVGLAQTAANRLLKSALEKQHAGRTQPERAASHRGAGPSRRERKPKPWDGALQAALDQQKAAEATG